ncbi:MAG: hypothetical protein HDQ44_02315 [Desulfovibrio sp.]|nr:hypothetical protein [Desulfovibrio sp.]
MKNHAMAKKNFPHDSSYKDMFSFPSMVQSLLLDFLPHDFVQYFDFSTLKPARASYVRDDFKQLHNDVVWQLNWRGRPSLLAILLEFQSADDYWMSARILAYTSNFWMDYIKSHELKSGDLLPALFPIVLYNGERPWQAPTSIQTLIDMPHIQFVPTQPYQIYQIIDAKRVSQAMLARAKGDAAYLIRAEQAKTGNDLAEIGVKFLARQTGADAAMLDEKVVKWLEKRIEKVEPDWQPSKEKEHPAMKLSEWLGKVQDEIAKGRAAAHAKGLEEGEVKGEAKGLAKGVAKGEAKVMSCQRAGLLEMLALKFGGIPAEWQNAVDKLNDPEQISDLTIAILKVQSQAEYGKLLLAASQS